MSGFRITDIDTMNTAVSIGRTLRARIKEVDRTMDGIIEPARRAWKNALALHKRIREPMAERLKKLELAVGTYKTEVERRRKAEEEARLAEIRRRQEDEARRRREREEQERRQREEYERKERERQEQIRKQEEERKKREEDARLAHAEAAEKAGELERATKILEAPGPLEPAKPVPPPVPKPGGTWWKGCRPQLQAALI